MSDDPFVPSDEDANCRDCVLRTEYNALKAEVARLRCELAHKDADLSGMSGLVDMREAEVARLNRPCARCGSTDRRLDADFHCSTCYANSESEANRLREALGHYGVHLMRCSVRAKRKKGGGK
jgi:hypothetical protein